MGERADAFEDADDLRAAIDDLDALLETVATAREEASDLASTLPELRGNLDDAHESAGGADPDADGDETEAEAE
jgi:ABC-type transporter Mla subunit MlaD